MLIAAVLLGLALAGAPAPYLGPAGPAWIGPLPPPGAPWTGLVIVVSPRDGRLWLEEADGPGRVRAWDGAGWTVNDQPLPEGDARYDLASGRLVAAEGPEGGERRFRYDDAARLVEATWPDGTRLQVSYDEQGRVVDLAGPGPARWRLEWGETLTVRDTVGRPTTLRWRREEGASAVLEVQDPLGRVSRSFYAGEERRLVGWQDPRGLQTTLRWADGELVARDGIGREWKIELDSAGRIRGLQQPGGQRWAWLRDAAGAVIEVRDPAGRRLRLQRDGAGRVVAAELAGVHARYQRDDAGRVIAITDPSGGVTRLERGPEGLVVALVDPLGSRVEIERYAAGPPLAIVSPTEGRWGVALDLLGRPDRVVDPTDRVVELERGGAGWLTRLRDLHYGDVRLGRAADGALTRAADSARSLSLLRDAAGQVSGIQVGEERLVEIRRDAAGDVRALAGPWGDLVLRRDSSGRPLQLGEVSWAWDSAGQVRALQAPGVDLQLQHDSSGRLSALGAGNWWLRVGRDAAGRPARWEGSDGAISATRDNAGRITREEGGITVDARRDGAGRISQISAGERIWRWLRDASGRPLKVVGPRELTLGVDRDSAGRVTLVRYPDGALARRRFEGAATVEALFSRGGAALLSRKTWRDAAGRVTGRQEDGRKPEVWRYTPAGDLAAVQGEGLWAREPDVISGPAGELLLFDAAGWLAEARVDRTDPLWGLGQGLLSAYRDGAGRLQEITGAAGAAVLGYDPVGRLVEIRQLDGGSWRLSYDSRGRLAVVTSPAGAVTPLLWAPDAAGTDPRTDAHLLASGADTAWVVGPGGAAACADGAGTTTFLTAGDGLVYAVNAAGTVTKLPASPLGFPDGGAGLLGPHGSVRIFPGGPLIAGGEAIDPVSGQRVDGARGWPWQPPDPWPVDVRKERWDPAPWAPQSPWSDPVALLLALGALPPLDGGEWTALPPAAPAVAWLPASLDGGEPPLGFAPFDLPLAEDPITTALLLAILPGGPGPEPGVVLDAILAEELGTLDLPPGFDLPGVPTPGR